MRVCVVSAAAAAADDWRQEALLGELAALVAAGHEVRHVQVGREAAGQDAELRPPITQGQWRWEHRCGRGPVAGVRQHCLRSLGRPADLGGADEQLGAAQAALAALAAEPEPPELVISRDDRFSLLPLLARDLWPTVRTVHRCFGRMIPHEQPISWGRGAGFAAAALSTEGMEYYSELSLTKAALLWADRVEFSSQSNLRVAQDPGASGGLAGVVRSRGEAAGVSLPRLDPRRWDPSAQLGLPAGLSTDNLDGKAACKTRLQAVFGLPVRPDVLLAVMLQLPGDDDGSQAVLQLVRRGLPEDVQLAVRGLSPELSGLKQGGDPRLGLRADPSGHLCRLMVAGADLLLGHSGVPGALDAQLGLRYGCVPLGLQDGPLPELSAPALLIGKDTAMGWTAGLAEAREAYQGERWGDLRHAALSWTPPPPDLGVYEQLQAGGPLGLAPPLP